MFRVEGLRASRSSGSRLQGFVLRCSVWDSWIEGVEFIGGHPKP